MLLELPPRAPSSRQSESSSDNHYPTCLLLCKLFDNIRFYGNCSYHISDIHTMLQRTFSVTCRPAKHSFVVLRPVVAPSWTRSLATVHPSPSVTGPSAARGTMPPNH